MMYNTKTFYYGTGTDSTYIRSTMASLGYQTSSWVNYSESFIRNNLNDGKPMFIGGDNYYGAHAWVVDGYDNVTYQYRTYAHPYGTIIWWVDSYGDTFTNYLYHFNWGWYGENNGYYNANVFDVSAVQFPDTNNNNHDPYNFKYHVKLLAIWH